MLSARAEILNIKMRYFNQLVHCIADVDDWMSCAATSERVKDLGDPGDVIGSRNQLDKITIHNVTVLSSSVSVNDTARDLGVVIDSQLTMVVHVSFLMPCLLLSASAAPPGCNTAVCGSREVPGGPGVHLLSELL